MTENTATSPFNLKTRVEDSLLRLTEETKSPEALDLMAKEVKEGLCLKTEKRNILSWLQLDSMPKGNRLIHLAYYLHSAGDDKIFLGLPGPIFTLCELIARNEIKIETIEDKIGRSDGYFMRLLLGTYEIQPEILRKLGSLSSHVQKGEPIEPITSKGKKESANSRDDALLIALKNAIATIVSVGGIVVSDNFSSEQRADFRESTGGTTFKASNILNCLCSEESRKQLQEK